MTSAHTSLAAARAPARSPLEALLQMPSTFAFKLEESVGSLWITDLHTATACATPAAVVGRLVGTLGAVAGADVDVVPLVAGVELVRRYQLGMNGIGNLRFQGAAGERDEALAAGCGVAAASAAGNEHADKRNDQPCGQLPNHLSPLIGKNARPAALQRHGRRVSRQRYTHARIHARRAGSAARHARGAGARRRPLAAFPRATYTRLNMSKACMPPTTVAREDR